MNIKVYAAGQLAYDSLLPAEAGYSMQSIHIKERVNTGGSAKLILPPRHILRHGFPAFKTLVEIYRDGRLRWRGRALPESRDIYCRGTILCEGELCFLQDSILRPGTYRGTLAEVFAQFIESHNKSVESWKQFVVGEVTVDTTEAAEIPLKSAVKTFAELQKLIAQYGGHIIFDTAEDGRRRINWYASMPYSCNQRIALGSNLIGYSTSVDYSGLATRIVPYGAKDADGNPVTINVEGKDYVESAEGIAQRGIIEAPATYPEISDPEELRAAAQADVDRAAKLPETIQLSALDLSRQNTSLEPFRVGQRVAADSATHELSGYYDLISLEEDLVNLDVGAITLTQEAAYSDVKKTLSGAVSSGQGAMQSYANAAAKEAVSAQTHEDVFNKLTKNGQIQGIYVEDDKWYINAEIAKILNLIVNHLLSNLDESSLEITGAILRLLSADNETILLTNQFKGLPILYMNDYAEDGARTHRGEYSPHHIRLGGTQVGGILTIGVDQSTGIPYLRIGEEGDALKISWKDNGDGTCTLIGSGY